MARPVRTELTSLGALTPDARNARRHNPRNVATVESSIQHDGFGRSILLANDGTIIAGNATVDAAGAAGIEDVLVVESDGTKVIAVKRVDVEPGSERFHKLALADNRAAELADWDPAVLDALAAEMDLSGLFRDDELAALLARIDDDDTGPGPYDHDAAALAAELPDDVDLAPLPPAEADAVTKPGDLWLLGAHRLLCGDATDADQVRRLMAGERSPLMPTDPPYLVGYRGDNHPQSHTNVDRATGEVGERHWDDYVEGEGEAFFRDFLRVALAEALTDRPAIYQCHADTRVAMVVAAWADVGLLLHQRIVWAKERAVPTRSHYMWQHEPISYGWVKGRLPERRPPANATTVWRVDHRGEHREEHPTQKPVELIRRMVAYHTVDGDVVYEPFAGSGTALVASEFTGRRCFAMELSPVFCDVVVARWERLAGATAELDR